MYPFFIADNNSKNFINQNNHDSHANFKMDVGLQPCPPQSLKQIKTIKKFLNSLTKTYGVSQHHQKHQTSATGRIYKKDISLTVHHSNQVETDWLCGGCGGRIVSYTEQ